MTRKNNPSSPQPQAVERKDKHPSDDNKTSLEGIHKRDKNSSNNKSPAPPPSK